MATNIDPAGLEDMFGHRSVVWHNLEVSAKYTSVVDDQPHLVRVWIQTATRDEITAYRCFDGLCGREGDVHTTFERAAEDAAAYAACEHVAIDEVELAEQIIDTGYFRWSAPDRPVTIRDILAVCRVTSGRTDGFLLIPRSLETAPNYPEWLPAPEEERWVTIPRRELVAHSAYVLLREIRRGAGGAP